MLDSEDLKEQALDEEMSQKLLHEVDSKEELVLPKEKKSGVLGKGDSCIDLGQGGEPEKQVNGQYQIVLINVQHSCSTFDGYLHLFSFKLRSVRSAVACSDEDSGAEVCFLRSWCPNMALIMKVVIVRGIKMHPFISPLSL